MVDVSIKKSIVIPMNTSAKARAKERLCAECGARFFSAAAIKTHCSPECRVRSMARRFDDVSGCWEWPGSRNPQNGYGQLSSWSDGKRRVYTAHRVSFLAFVGEIEAGKHVLHKCDNRPCFNPDHLFIGTHKENMEDMSAKGRATSVVLRGSKHGKSKITEKQAREIRSSSAPLATLSRIYGISFSAISAIRTGKTWTHI